MGRPKKPVDPAVLLKAQRNEVSDRFYTETRIALNDEHKRLIADFVLRERKRERLATIQDIRIRIVTGQITANTLFLGDEELRLKEQIGPDATTS